MDASLNPALAEARFCPKCGQTAEVEFPQRIGSTGETIKLQVKDGVHVLAPSPFAQPVEFSLKAQPYPAEGKMLSAKLNWQVR